MRPVEIDDWENLKAHPAAEAFRLMAASEIQDLVQDIKRNGFDPRFPIVLLNGLVLE